MSSVNLIGSATNTVMYFKPVSTLIAKYADCETFQVNGQIQPQLCI